MQTGTTDKEIQACLDQISRWIQMFLPRSLDGDFLVLEIWLEAQRANIPVTRQMVKWRCVDLMRKELKRQSGVSSDDQPSNDQTQLEARDTLNRLMRIASLSPQTKQLIYLIYYRSLSIPDAAFELKIPIGKARDLNDHALKLLRTIYENNL